MAADPEKNLSELHRILLVEDDLDIQLVARVALHDLSGFELEVCSSGHEALQRAPEVRPDLVLLDVMMPGLDGRETFLALRRIPEMAATPMIFMTAKAQPEDVAEYRRLGITEVIAKPFDPLTLGDQIREVWSRLDHEGTVPGEKKTDNET